MKSEGVKYMKTENHNNIQSESSFQLNEKNKGITITIGNRKGGAGKTSNSVLIAYTLARRGIRTLVVDLDAQANATKSLLLTRSLHTEEEPPSTKSMMASVIEGTMEGMEIEVMDNLYVMPGYKDMEDFADFYYLQYKNVARRDFIISDLLKPLKNKYDIILIDVPPVNKEISANAIVASDYVLISLQTQERSLTGAEEYVEELDRLNQLYDLDLYVLGILPVLMKKDGAVDQTTMAEAVETFGEENVFNTHVTSMERVKRFDYTGITENERDIHDRRVHELFEEVTIEFVDRLNEWEEFKRGEDNVE